METNELEYTTEQIDHLGIVAGICQQINLIERIDESRPIPTERKVSCGQAVQAMVLNGLVGLTGRALYLMPEYMCTTYGEIRQRWLLVYSQPAYVRESQQLDKRLAQAEQCAEKAWRTLQRTPLQCPADAQAARQAVGGKAAVAPPPGPSHSAPEVC